MSQRIIYWEYATQKALSFISQLPLAPLQAILASG
jgi:hypothetical protein